MKILAVIDMQNDFINGVLGSKDAEVIVDKVVRRIKSFDGDEIDVTLDTHDDNYLSTQEGRNLPIPHTKRGTLGWQLHPNIREALSCAKVPVKYFEKGGFGSKELAIHLEEINATEVTWIGLDTGYCVISNVTTSKTFSPETLMIVDADCCACASKESHETALKAMQTLHVKILNWEGTK